jgi:hypothetical protein
MSAESFKRRLTAILGIDVGSHHEADEGHEGFSRRISNEKDGFQHCRAHGRVAAPG